MAQESMNMAKASAPHPILPIIPATASLLIPISRIVVHKLVIRLADPRQGNVYPLRA